MATAWPVVAAAISMRPQRLPGRGGERRGPGPRPEPFVASIRSTLYERCLPMATEDLQVVTTRTGRLAGVTGAAHLMLEYLLDPARVNAAIG